jgi:hypothetical protein
MLNTSAAELPVMQGMLAAFFHGTCITASSEFATLHCLHLCSRLFLGRILESNTNHDAV